MAFLHFIGALLLAAQTLDAPPTEPLPNVILVMTDDQGWGDVGFHGHPYLQTPHLDEMAASGVRFDRFYAAAPVCSPTRGSCLTGRHPYRYGIHFANTGHLPTDEFNLATYLKEQGYRTGHFGKWHLGTMTTSEQDSNRGGPKNAAHFAPPWQRGFDVCFSTESKVPTFDPMITPGKVSGGVGEKKAGTAFGTFYWNEKGKKIGSGDGMRPADWAELRGDDSQLIMNHALDFVQESAQLKQPFFAVVWFHAPHLPVVASEEHRQLYDELGEMQQHYFGALTAVDQQLGRLRSQLRQMGIADDTMLWFCSDNGPEGKANKPLEAPGSAGPLRGRKRDLYEGGIRVPGVMEWPGRIKQPLLIHAPCSTLDYAPTIVDVIRRLTLPNPDQSTPVPLMSNFDGISLLPLLSGQTDLRQAPLGFESGNQAVWMEDQFKLFTKHAHDAAPKFELYDLLADPAESQDLAADHPDVVARMASELKDWRRDIDLDQRIRDPRPNIVFIMADDLGKEWISCYGAEEMETPNIDALAASGMRFTNAYSMPLCTPTRTTLLTGQYPFRHGWVNHWDVPRWGEGCHFDPEQNFSIARLMRQAGYATSIAGKWQINDFRLQPDVLREHGFSDWCVWTGYEKDNPPSILRYWDPYLHTRSGSKNYEGQFGADVFRTFTIDFLRRNRHQPTFAYFPMCLPHLPYTTTPNQPDAQSQRQKYRAMVEYVDQCVGEITAAIDEMGLGGQTIIIFTTDNGGTRGISALRNGTTIQGGKGQLGENGCNVPFIVRTVGRRPRLAVSEELLDFSDLFPTFAELAGATAPADLQLDGHSFAPHLASNSDYVGREWVMAMGGGKAVLRDGKVVGKVAYADRMLRNVDYKLWIENGNPSRLYNLKLDPLEQNNLMDSPLQADVDALLQLTLLTAKFPQNDAVPHYTPIVPTR